MPLLMKRPVPVRAVTALLRAVVCGGLLVSTSATEARAEAEGGAAQASVLGTSPEETAPAAVTTPPLSRYQAYLLRKWFEAVGEPKAKETFGELVARAARLQLGKPYGAVHGKQSVEQLRVRLSRFECVSLVETTLAVARCAWVERRDEECFMEEVEASRYRNGELNDYASRLHYFTDWLDDNVRRGRAKSLTQSLGGEPRTQVFNLLSLSSDKLSDFVSSEQLERVRLTEEELSAREHHVIPRSRIRIAQRKLQSGDLLAIVSDKVPGVMVGHVGFVDRTAKGSPKFLHASSYHRRVVLTVKPVSHYATRQAHRKGVIVVRPLPPTTAVELARAVPLTPEVTY